MPCQHVVFNFCGRWIRRAVPAWWFWKFIAVDGFSLADVPVSHFVSHADTSGASGATPGTSAPGFEVLEASPCPQGKFDDLNNVDRVPTNVQFSHQEAL